MIDLLVMESPAAFCCICRRGPGRPSGGTCVSRPL